MTALIALVTAADIPAHKKPDEQHLVAALRAHGFDCDEVVWNNPDVEWNSYDAVLIRSTWDYHLRAEFFQAWLTKCEQASVPLFNPASLVRWNMHKSYLLELAARGVQVVKSSLFHRGDSAQLAQLVGTGNEIVIKPAISATAWHTRRFTSGFTDTDQDWLDRQLQQRDILVQPFLPEIAEQGELSFMFFNGEFSHAVLKRARAGEFRVQSDFGGSETPYSATPGEIEQAGRMLAALKTVPLYARVDVARHDNQLLLMELELIEPQLFLRLHAPAADRLVAAIANSI